MVAYTAGPMVVIATETATTALAPMVMVLMAVALMVAPMAMAPMPMVPMVACMALTDTTAMATTRALMATTLDIMATTTATTMVTAAIRALTVACSVAILTSTAMDTPPGHTQADHHRATTIHSILINTTTDTRLAIGHHTIHNNHKVALTIASHRLTKTSPVLIML